MPERPGPSRPGRCWFGQRASIKGWSGGWVEVGLGQVPVVVTDEPSQHPALLVTVVEVDVRDALSQAPSAAYPPPYRANAHGSASPAEGRKPLVTAGRNPESAILRRQRFRTPAVGASMVCRRQLCGRPCWHWRRPRRPALPIRDHGGPATYGYLRHPCRRGLPGRRDPDTTQRPPSQTVSTSEHATTPEHPCPGVVARTGPQAVNPSPVSGESMASGGYACGRASPPPTSPGNAADAAGVTARGGHRPAMGGHCGKRPRGAFFPGAAPEPGWRWRHQPGPWGRWPTRRCAAERHLTTDLPENASGAAGVTAAGEVPRHEQPRGPPSRGRSSSTY
jgi:hypothetical protein